MIREGVWVAQTDVDRPHTEIRLPLLKKIEHLHRTKLQMLCCSHEIYFLALLNACCSSHVPTCIAQLSIYIYICKFIYIYIYLCLHCPKPIQALSLARCELQEKRVCCLQQSTIAYKATAKVRIYTGKATCVLMW